MASAGASLSHAVDQGLLNAALAGPEPEASHISVVESRSFRDQVRRALEAALVAGELKPGELYSAPVLGERFGVSATPVREAMLALAKDGFVVAERNRGFRVVELSDKDLDEVSQIRLLVEVPSTVEAAALCKMADRGQITGCVVDGPLAFDNAIDPEAAKIKGIVSPVAGRAQILVVPDLEAGNMLAKELSFLANADAAGIVLGARVPIILTSRADTVIARLASCAVASLVAEARRRNAGAAI